MHTSHVLPVLQIFSRETSGLSVVFANKDSQISKTIHSLIHSIIQVFLPGPSKCLWGHQCFHNSYSCPEHSMPSGTTDKWLTACILWASSAVGLLKNQDEKNMVLLLVNLYLFITSSLESFIQLFHHQAFGAQHPLCAGILNKEHFPNASILWFKRGDGQRNNCSARNIFNWKIVSPMKNEDGK